MAERDRKLFISNLLTYPDYLLNAVLDTPWPNRPRLKSRPPNFSASVEELFLFFDFLIGEEEKEIGHLLKQPRDISKKAILDALLENGLLASAVLNGIQSCRYYGFVSTVHGALEWANSADTDAKIKICEKNLASLVDRITKARDAVGRWTQDANNFIYEEDRGQLKYNSRRQDAT